MNRLINQPPSAIKLDINELLLLSDYITKNIDFYSTRNATEIIKRWHVIELYTKIEKGIAKIMWTKKKYSLKINEIEKHCMSVLFQHRECNGFMIVISEHIIKGLIKINKNAA